MPKMLELIRQSAVPVNVMRTASKGALDLPASEMIEVLVHLTKHPLFGQDARMTLAGWEYESALAVVSDPATPKQVLSYFAHPDHLRPDLFPALLENAAVPDAALATMAEGALRSTVDALLKHPRTQSSVRILHALTRNDNLRTAEIETLERQIAELSAANPHYDEDLTDAALAAFEAKHADELAAEADKLFEFFVHGADEVDAKPLPKTELQAQPQPETSHGVDGVTTADATAASNAAEIQVPAKPEPERISPLQKIARMKVGERVQLAMKGSKDERFILIRDGSKVVSAAVLDSPKLTDAEVETFAAMKNVQESVLRTIAGKRKFMKLYAVIRALVNNPRTPIDVSLPLLNHLLVMDLRALSSNKNVGDLLRKMAFKLFKERTETKKQH